MQPPTIPVINQELRILRRNAGLSQMELASRLGVNQSTVSVVERGGTTTTEIVDAWVKACEGRLTVIPASADPWAGIPETLRAAASEVARLWAGAEESTRNAILLMLRGLHRKA